MVKKIYFVRRVRFSKTGKRIGGYKRVIAESREEALRKVGATGKLTKVPRGQLKKKWLAKQKKVKRKSRKRSDYILGY